jgi:protein-disulfide isomerase
MRGALVLIAGLVLAGCGAKAATLPLPASAPSKGAPAATVVVQEAGDFECPFCASVQPTLRALLARYAGRVRLVWRDYPLPRHFQAPLAAEAAREVHAQGGDAKFWAYHDLLFASRGALDRASLERHADQVGGIDMVRFRGALDMRIHKAAVEADVRAVMQTAGPVGAPTFFIGDEILEGAFPLDVFEAAVEKALSK